MVNGVLAFTSFFMIFTDLGLNTYSIREISKFKNRAQVYLSNLLILKVILSILTLFFIIIFINIIKNPYDTTLTIYLLGISFIFSSISGSFNSIFNAFQKMEFNAFSKIFNAILLFVLYMGSITLGYGIVGLATATIFVNIFMALINYGLLKKYFFRLKHKFSLNFAKNLFKNALPFGLNTIFSLVYFKIDIIMLALLLKDNAAVGLYNAVTRLIVHSTFIPLILAQTIFPIMSLYHKRSKKPLNKLLKKSLKYAFLISILISLFVLIFADKIILIVYGEQFLQATNALRILSIFYIFITLNIIIKTFLNSINKQRIVRNVILFGAGLNILLNFYFIPRYSYIGASITTLISEIISFIIFYIYIKRY